MSLKRDLWLSRRPLTAFALMAFAWAAFFAQMPVIKAQVGASDGQWGMAVFVASLSAVAAMWLAPFADRSIGRTALPLASLFLVGGMLAAGSTTTILWFVAALTLASVSAGVVDVLTNVRISEAEAASGRSLMNLNHGMYSLSYGVAAFVTGFFREWLWSPLEVFALFFVITLGLSWVMIEPATKPKPSSRQEARASVSTALVLTMLGGGVVMVAYLVEASAEGWSALHLERTLDGDPSQGALGPAILGFTMAVGRLSGHFVSRRLPEVKLMTVASLVAAFGLALAGVAPTLVVAYLGFGLAGLGVSVVGPLALALIGRTVAPEARLDTISRASVMGLGAYFFGPPLMGFTAEVFGLRTGFVLVGGIMVMTALIALPALARHAAEHRARRHEDSHSPI